MEIPKQYRIWKNGNYKRIIGAVGHPLAKGKDHVIPLHRYVLFEYLGRPEKSNCTYCGYQMPWTIELEEGQHWTAIKNTCVCVDHIDEDPSNNDPTNLATSCVWCNANKWLKEKHPEAWKWFIETQSDLPPIERDNPLNYEPIYKMWEQIQLSKGATVEELAAKAGRVKSAKKAKAARENGKKGGRPKLSQR